MNSQLQLLEWGNDILNSKGYSIKSAPQVVLSTPWSKVFCFSTEQGNYYLKQTPSSIFLSNEPSVIRLLSHQFNANVPKVIEINDDLHCFLMEDAGKSLRETLKTDFKPELLYRAIQEYVAIQRSAENQIEEFLKLGSPDWRLEKLPDLYTQMIERTDFLKSEGIAEKELYIMNQLNPIFSAKCKLLSDYGIPETIGYHDFHDKNILIDSKTKRLTFVDWGETAIIHPFFSLFTCLEQSVIHHGINEGDQVYQKLQEACFEGWLELVTQKELLQVSILIKQIRPFWELLACYQFMMGIDLDAFNAYYPNRISPIKEILEQFIMLIRSDNGTIIND